MNCQPQSNRPVYIWLNNKQACLLCHEASDGLQPICVPCEAELPWLARPCPRCALPLPGIGDQCVACSQRRPAFSQVVAPWRYSFPVDSLITAFKHHSQWPVGKLLAGLLAQHLQAHFDNGQPRPDALLPVPLARQRLRQRGFNQASMLANWLGKPLNLTVEPDWLQRVRDTPAQQGLDAKTRRRNLKQAFSLHTKAQVHGKHLALIDDVLTTGSTADTLARLLLEAGACQVDVYCLARTPSPQERPQD